MKKLPVEVVSSEGYITMTFENDDYYVMHFLAKDYDTDIDHKLDEMRFHRSRVNYVNKVTPINVSEKITIRTNLDVEVYTPLNSDNATVTCNDGVCDITLPKETSYAIVRFKK